MYDQRWVSLDKDASFHNLAGQSDKKSAHVYSRDLLQDLRQSQQRLNVQELENKVVMLVTENERLQDMLRDKQRELELMNEEHTLLQQQIQNQKDERFKHLETKATKMIYENEKVLLMNQSLSLQMEELQYHYDSLQKKFQVETELIEQKWKLHYQELYEQQQAHQQECIEKLLKELKQSSDIIKQYEDRVGYFQKEVQVNKDQSDFKEKKCNELILNNQQLTLVIQQQEQTMKNLQEKNLTLNSQFDKICIELNNSKHLQQNLENDLEQRKIKYEELIIHLEELKMVENKQRQQLSKNDFEFGQYKQEILEMKQKLQEITQQNYRSVQDLNQSFNRETNQLKKQVSQLIQENEELMNIERMLRSEIQAEKVKSQQLQQTLNSQDQEIRNKDQGLMNLSKELEVQKLKFDKIYSENSQHLKQQQNHFEIKLLQLQQANKLQVEQIIIQKGREIQSLSDRINVLLGKIDEQENYIRTLTYQTNEKADEIEDSRPQIQSLKNELHRLQQLTVEQSNEIDNMKLKLLRVEENHEMQLSDTQEKLSKVQDEFTLLKAKHAKTSEDYVKQSGSLQETLANLSKLQNLLSETHQQLKLAENKIELQQQEIQDLLVEKEQNSILKEKHSRELENLKKAFESNIKVKIDKEIAQEREKLENYAASLQVEKRQIESQVQSLLTENQLLKNEISQQQEYFKLQVQDLIVDQQKHLLNIDSVYKLELKGLSEAQQIQFNSIVSQLQSQINGLYNENQILIAQNNKFVKQLKKSEKKNSRIICEMDQQIYSLQKDNERLIDEKVYQRSKNTFLETQLRRSHTPIREVRSNSQYYRRGPGIAEVTVKRPILCEFDLNTLNY